MLKYRLIFGTLMIILFVALLVFDGWLDDTLADYNFIQSEICKNSPMLPVKGTIFCIIIVAIAIPAQIELRNLVKNTGAHIFLPLTIIASILLAAGKYIAQAFDAWAYPNTGFYVPMSLFEMQAAAMVVILAISLLLIFFFQAKKFATNSVIANFGANIFAILYLGFFASFVLSIRIDFGVWALIMYIFTIKFADIGAFTLGSLIGKHKFSPKISPGKTWEGMAGAVIFSTVISSFFAHFVGIMTITQAIIFGVMFAFLGQFGDLTESMLKRDAHQKDSSSTVPGFGGILDIIDSLLIAAPIAYLFFNFVI